MATFPPALDAARQLAAQDDPVALADLALDTRLDAPRAGREIEAALAADDPELARSFVDLADARGLAIDTALRARVAAANETAAAALRAARRFAGGFVAGAPDDMASLAGTITGDLFVYGDLRDAVRETANLARGDKADELILGLACVGLAVTAGTYASLGAGAPARVGISLVKAASKTGRMTAGMAEAVVRPLRAAVDTAALRGTFHPAALLSPAAAVRQARAAVKIEKAEPLMRVVSDIGRVNASAGTRAALDGMRLAHSPKDVTRLARLAQAKGSTTRAVLKVAGRGALVVTAALWSLASATWWWLMFLIGFVVALKRATERMTLSYLRWRKQARLRRLAKAALAG